MDEFWASSLVEGGVFYVVVDMIKYAQDRCEDRPLALGDWSGNGPYGKMEVGVADVDLFYIKASLHGAIKTFAMIAERAKVGVLLAAKVAVPSTDQHVADCLQADVRLEMLLGI